MNEQEKIIKKIKDGYIVMFNRCHYDFKDCTYGLAVTYNGNLIIQRHGYSVSVNELLTLNIPHPYYIIKGISQPNYDKCYVNISELEKAYKKGTIIYEESNIKIGNRTVEFENNGIRVGCTFVYYKTIEDIMQYRNKYIKQV